jgi:hypothetical protein
MNTKFIKGLFLGIYVLLNSYADAQTIPVVLIYHQKEIKLTNSISSSDFHITNLKFYLSNIRLYKTNSLVDEELNSYHLIDLLDTSKNKLKVRRNNNLLFDRIDFNLGIDSLTNVSGAYEGDLDPMNNMYWTWQSGYINLKFEGAIDDEVYREYHLGGYAYPNNALQKVSLKMNSSSNPTIYIHLDDFIHSIPDSIPFKFMMPDPKAVYLSQLFAKCLSSEK